MEVLFRVLIVDDEPEAARRTSGLLDPTQYSVQLAIGGAEALALVRKSLAPLDMMLIDSDMPGMNGFETLKQLRRLYPETPIAIMTESLNAEFMFDGIKAGAQGFLHKPAQAAEVRAIAAKFCGDKQPAQSTDTTGVHIEDLGNGQFFLAASPSMRAIVRQVKMLSRADVPVLITGESGVGKEIVATLLHKHSLRAARPMLKVNCAALPADLLESELFGYEAGAFTGAMKSKPGKFDMCDKGTMMLDEIGEMSPALQAKLLHVLQDGSFSRLGGRVNSKVDVRVIAATNVDIEQAIINKTFREDLYYRLNAFVIKVPSLRERSQEIPYLLAEFAHTLAIANRMEPINFSPRLIAAAVRYPWPGNLRELGNFVKRYLIMRDEAMAFVELESKVRPQTATMLANSASAQADVDGLKSVVRTMKDQTEIRVIREVLDDAKWNRRIAAEKLQISYKALLYKIRQYNLEASA
ncbi:sigma-54-dependent transcriptional regulator [Acidipila rosea]|uniref:DNA-binding NtrC family response regulator n=1 Tax=Acidipila rosea TaxID=768535 RepID=A0A4R1LB16_9BACT|nr:sigma-54 dependent transcriptional regulator [Acidipila rosea]MBW4027392.1 sigma-54-dependent Fis family transcriptional regulator [Acidobacteriota bacterium]TCK75535.1 DNA-binding NtrC family response regulator [Acidipila rosea]